MKNKNKDAGAVLAIVSLTFILLFVTAVSFLQSSGPVFSEGHTSRVESGGASSTIVEVQEEASSKGFEPNKPYEESIPTGFRRGQAFPTPIGSNDADFVNEWMRRHWKD